MTNKLCRLTPGLPDTTQDAPLIFGVARRMLIPTQISASDRIVVSPSLVIPSEDCVSRINIGLIHPSFFGGFSACYELLSLFCADNHFDLQCLRLRLFLRYELSLSNQVRMSSNLFIKCAEAC